MYVRTGKRQRLASHKFFHKGTIREVELDQNLRGFLTHMIVILIKYLKYLRYLGRLRYGVKYGGYPSPKTTYLPLDSTSAFSLCLLKFKKHHISEVEGIPNLQDLPAALDPN